MNQNQSDSVYDWLYWLFLGLVVAACISYPIRMLFFPSSYGKLSIAQEILVFVATAVVLAVCIVRPVVKNLERGVDGE